MFEEAEKFAITFELDLEVSSVISLNSAPLSNKSF